MSQPLSTRKPADSQISFLRRIAPTGTARVNAKTVSVETEYSWTDIVPYAEVQDLKRPE